MSGWPRAMDVEQVSFTLCMSVYNVCLGNECSVNMYRCNVYWLIVSNASEEQRRRDSELKGVYPAL